MMSVNRLAALIVILSIGGTLAVAVGRPDGSTTAPGAEASPVASPSASPLPSFDPMTPSFFTGASPSTTACLIDGGATQVVGQVIQKRDVSYGCFRWRTDDPRINGTSRIVWNSDDYMSSARTATGRVGQVFAARERIENDAGAWEGTTTQLQVRGTPFDQIAGWFKGEGAYEGLWAYVVITEPNGAGTLWGYIAPGRLETPEAFLGE